jgi:uncharacterized integral membrane protein
MRVISWVLRAFIFFALFAFALNNQHEASVRWFFGYRWAAPMVFIVLAAFGLGCCFGVLAMLGQTHAFDANRTRHTRRGQRLHARTGTPTT